MSLRDGDTEQRRIAMNARAGFSFVVFASLLAIALVMMAPTAPAQDRIDKPVRIVVGFAAGGTADVMARVVADKLKDSVGQPVIVDNRPGAIGRIAAEAVKNAPPDGATIMVMPIGPMAVVPHVYSDITYDPVKDFTAVALGSTFQFAIAAGPASGAKTWSEFAAWVKANPGKAAYATSGAGSLPHFFGVLISQVPAAVDAIADLTELHRAGRIRILASSGAARSTAVPEVPTFNELGLKGVEASGWFGFFAPAKTPKPIVDLLNRGINKALQSPDVVEKLTKLGLDPATGTPEEFARIVASDYAKWGPIVKASGFKPE
jgi:tripartite-type tricarboxylate transporter receptor subunit TctC